MASECYLRITDKLYGVEFPVLRTIPNTLTVAQLADTVSSYPLFQSPQTTTTSSTTPSPSQYIFLYNGRVLHPSQLLADLKVQSIYREESNGDLIPCVDLTLNVINPSVEYQKSMEQKWMHSFARTGAATMENALMYPPLPASLYEPLLRAASEHNNINARAAPPAGPAGGNVQNNAQNNGAAPAAGVPAENRRRIMVFRLQLDFNWIVRLAIFALLVYSDPSMAFFGGIVLVIVLLRTLAARLFPNRFGPNANNGAGNAGAGGDQAAPAVPRRAVLHAEGRGALGWVVTIERFVYGLFASILPNWTPEEVPAAAAAAPAPEPVAEPVEEPVAEPAVNQPVQEDVQAVQE